MAKRKRTQGPAAQPRQTQKQAAGPQKHTPGQRKAASFEPWAEKVVWWCLHAIVFAVPLAVSNFSWLGFQLPYTFDQFDIVKVVTMRVLTLIALGAFSWAVLTKGGKLRLSKPELLLIGLFILWVVVTTVLSISPPTAVFGKYRRFEGLLSFVNYALVFFLALQVIDRPGKIRSLSKTLVVSATMVSLYGVAQYVGIDPIRWGNLPFETHRGFATYGNPDLLGNYLIFPLAIALGLILSTDDEGDRAIWWGAFLVIVAAWLTAFVRGSWIGGAIALVIIVIAAWRGGLRLKRVDWGFLGGTAVIAAFIVVRSMFASSDVLNIPSRLVSIFKFNEGSAKTRFEIWQAAWSSVTDGPRSFVFGHGADTFRLVFPKYKPYAYTADAGYLSVADNVHDYPLQLMSALGVPGFLLLYGIFTTILVRSFRQAFPKDASGDRIIYTAFWAAAVGYLVDLFFGISVTGSTIFLWISLAILVSPLVAAFDFKAPSWGVVPAVAISLFALFGVYFNGVYISADHAYLMSRVGSRDPALRVAYAEKAVKLNPWNDMYRAEVGLAYQAKFVQVVTAEQQGQATRQQSQEAFDQAVSAMRSVIALVPSEYDNYVFIASLYNQGAAYLSNPAYAQEAVDWSKKGMEVEPYGPYIRLQGALAYNALGQYPEAIKLLESAMAMDPNYVEPLIALGDVYDRAGQKDKARQVYLDAQKRFPGNALVQQAVRGLEASSSTGTK